MLKSTSSQDKKNRNHETSFQEAMNLIRGSLYKQATNAFIELLKNDGETISTKLINEFSDYFKSGQFEAAAAIGQALRGVLGHKASFLVSLGNCYRHLMNYQKANDLYRNALRSDKSYKLALYNLGASLAKVGKYDHEIKKSLDQFKGIKGYVLPPYLNDPDIVDKITVELEQERKHCARNVEVLRAEKKQKQQADDTESLEELEQKIETEERQLALPDYQAICKKLRRAIKTNWAKQTIEESKANLQENLFNLGLYALSQDDLSLARESLMKLETEQCHIDNLEILLAITLDLDGYSNRAIDKLIQVLKQNSNNRYAVVNLGLMYRKRGNTLLSIRHLLKAAELLEKSEGLYEPAEIEARARDYFENNKVSKAFDMYHIIIKEKPNVQAWNRIGEIHMKREELIDATMAFHEAQEIDPNDATAREKLVQIHDLYVMKGDTEFRNGFNLEAVAFYQNALEIHRSVSVMNKAVKAYKKLNDFSQVSFLKNEIQRSKQLQQEENLEKKRQALIKQGKLLMKQKKYNQAIEHLEAAFDIKPDKDTFLLLAHILKALRKNQKLTGLVKRWRTLTERNV